MCPSSSDRIGADMEVKVVRHAVRWMAEHRALSIGQNTPEKYVEELIRAQRLEAQHKYIE